MSSESEKSTESGVGIRSAKSRPRLAPERRLELTEWCRNLGPAAGTFMAGAVFGYFLKYPHAVFWDVIEELFSHAEGLKKC